MFLQVLVVLGATDHAEVVAGGGQGTFGVVLSHALQTKEIGLLSLGFAAVDCCAVVADELQAEFIYEHVEGAKAVANTGVGSVGIHDNVGIVRGQDEKLHEEPSRPAVVVSHLVQTCDLVVLVHGSHVPETRGKVRVPGGRTFMQNCVKRSGGLTYLVFSTTSVARSTARAGPPHACSQWTLSSGCGNCSRSGWACGPSRRWHTELPGTRICTGHVRSASCRVPWGSACGLA